MSRGPRSATRWLGAATLLLCATHGWLLAAHPHGYLALLHAFAMAVSLPAGLLLLRRPRFACRMAAAVTAVASGAGVLLGLTVGLPGLAIAPAPHVADALLLVLALAIPLTALWAGTAEGLVL